MRKRYWTKERIWQEAARYGTYNEFARECPSLYKICRTRGWLEELKTLLPGRYGSWTYEQCLSEARRCESRADFVSNHRNTYNIARYHGWLDRLCKDVPRIKIKKKR